MPNILKTQLYFVLQFLIKTTQNPAPVVAAIHLPGKSTLYGSKLQK